MIEQEWLTSTNPAAMLEWLTNRGLPDGRPGRAGGVRQRLPGL
jgi:hypothetical protein